MYCGTNKTALQSQQQLADALLRLLERKPYQSITVSELCREACISRQTFYTLFQSKENVVSYTLVRRCAYTLDDGEETLRQICRSYRMYLQGHADILRVLVENNITDLLYDGFYEDFLSCEHFMPGMAREVREYAADFMAGGFTSIARSYVRTGANTEPDLLEDLIYALFTGAVFQEQARGGNAKRAD